MFVDGGEPARLYEATDGVFCAFLDHIIDVIYADGFLSLQIKVLERLGIE